MTIYDVNATELIEELAKELQKIETIKPPEWAIFVKTGAHKERPPVREDWWYVRAASVLRKVRLKGPIGVSKLRTLYGGKKNRGYKPERFKKGSGNIIRKILQQLEKAELIKKAKKEVHKGRLITPKGIKLIDNVSNKIIGHKPVKKTEVKEVKGISKAKEKTVEEKKPIVPNSSSTARTKEKTKTTESKTEELVKKTKEFAQGKIPTTEKLVEESKKEKPKEEKKVPKAAELAKKKEQKNG